MYISERSEALQAYFFPKYRDFLQCVLFCGGCVLHSQMSRLLFGNRPDCKQATQLAKNLIDAHILNKQTFGVNNLYTLTAFTLRYFNVKYPRAVNVTRIKMSSLVFESFLYRGYYAKDDPPRAMLERLNKSGVAYYATLGMPQLHQMLHLRDAFTARGFAVDGINYQISRMQKRVDFALSDERPHRLDLPKEPDLYSISRKNIYLSGVAVKPDNYGREHPVALADVYYISDWPPYMMCNNLIEAKQTIEDTLQNGALAVFTVHSHSKENPKYERNVKDLLLHCPEFLTPDDIDAALSFKWYGTSQTLFSGIDPKNFI